MAGAKRFTPIRGRVMRMTRLDSCGRPVYGDESQVVSEGFVTVNFTANVDAGEEVRVTNAAGKTLAHEPAKPTFNGYNIEIAFAQVDPGLFALATGQVVIEDPVTGEAIGFGVDSDVDPDSVAFALEVWTGVPNVECTDEGAGTYGYLLLPFNKGGVFGDFTIENGAITFTVSNISTRTGSTWGAGPYDVMLGADTLPGPLVGEAIVGTSTHLRVILVEVAPPTDAAGLYPVLDPTDSAITGFTATAGTGNEVDFSPTPAAPTEPVVYDFGDGTWEYVVGGVHTHTYAAPGTYTVKASRGSSSFTDDIVVPIV